MRLTWLLIATACGRVGFHGASDAALDASPDAVAQVPRLVATNDGTIETDATTLQVTITEVTAGDLLVVAIADHEGHMVASIVDANGHALTSAGVFASMASIASDLWYETDTAPTNGVTITMATQTTLDAWVGEFAGTHVGPPDITAHGCVQYPPTIAAAAGTTTVPNELVVTAMMAKAPLYVSQTLPPFIGFLPLDGNDASYYVPADPGTYGATYGISSGNGMTAMTCASTAVWLPGP